MALTLKWWTDLKGLPANKVNGKLAPETEFEKKLKVYDTRRGEHADSPSDMARAEKALGEVDAARVASTKELIKLGFDKLAAHCNPNTRVLSALIRDEKTMMAAAKPQVEAISKIGSPVLNLNTGPGKSTIRQGKFEELQDKVKQLSDKLKSLPQLKKEDIDGCVTEMEKLEKDVKLYCGDRPTLKSFQEDYLATVLGFKAIKAKWGDKKVLTTEMQKIGTQLARLVSAQYVS